MCCDAICKAIKVEAPLFPSRTCIGACKAVGNVNGVACGKLCDMLPSNWKGKCNGACEATSVACKTGIWFKKPLNKKEIWFKKEFLVTIMQLTVIHDSK